MPIVGIPRDQATIDDLFAHADLLEETATQEDVAHAARTREAAKVALVRAGGDRTVLLRDVRDQAFN
jgi:hypothetical protein